MRLNDVSEGRCGTCRHWGATDTFGGYPGYKLRTEVDARSCARSEGIGEMDRADPYMEASASDDHGAVLLTTAGFGCVLWEPSTEESES